MARLRVREVLEQYKLPRTRVARRADLANDTMERLWKHPEDTAVQVATLEKVAAAISQMLREEREIDIRITVHDLIDVDEKGIENLSEN